MKKNRIKMSGGGANSCQVVNFVANFGRDLNTPNLCEAFTLAEVLITLVIIGVVAALTIPAIVKNYQEREMVSRYKKFYSTMLQVNAKAIQDFGPMRTWRFNNNNEFFAYIKPYLRIARKCPDYASSRQRECGRYNGFFTVTDPIYALEDGSIINFQAYSTKENRWAIGDYGFTTGGVRFDVDLNGEKGPNKSGIDLHRFQYYIYQQKFIPSSVGTALLAK